MWNISLIKGRFETFSTSFNSWLIYCEFGDKAPHPCEPCFSVTKELPFFYSTQHLLQPQRIVQRRPGRGVVEIDVDIAPLRLQVPDLSSPVAKLAITVG